MTGSLRLIKKNAFERKYAFRDSTTVTVYHKEPQINSWIYVSFNKRNIFKTEVYHLSVTRGLLRSILRNVFYLYKEALLIKINEVNKRVNKQLNKIETEMSQVDNLLT